MQGSVYNVLGAAMVIVFWWEGGRTRPWAELGRVGTWSLQGNTL